MSGDAGSRPPHANDALPPPAATAEPALSLERLFSGPELAGASLRQLKIAPDSRRIAFLRANETHPESLDLWEYVLAQGQRRRLVEANALAADTASLSAAELARRERSRQVGVAGILHYQWAPDSRRLLFQLGAGLYLCELAGEAIDIHRLPLEEPVLDPRFSPRGRYISYLKGQNLWLLELASGQSRALTHDGGGGIHNGEAEFIAQEELDRSEGYWWAPDDSLLAFQRYDDSTVSETFRLGSEFETGRMHAQRYPFASTANVTWRLGLIAPWGDQPVRWLDLDAEGDGYLARVQWRPDARALCYQYLSRNQQRLELRQVDVASLAAQTVCTETSKDWLNLNEDLHFLGNGDFLWGSERSGQHRLYRYTGNGRLQYALGDDRPIDGLLAVDEVRGLVYISANHDFAPDRQLYALSLTGEAPPKRISKEDGHHLLQFSPDGSFYVDTWSNPATPPKVSLRHPDGSFYAWLEANALQAEHPFWPYREGLVLPEFGQLVASDGQTLDYRLYKPKDFDPERRYPVFNHFYGGPHAQLVNRAWGNEFDQYMARQGFIVFSLDNRGMARRGHHFESPIHGRLGEIEVADQVLGLNWLRRQPWVDSARIGVFGWSYGGYLSLMLQAKAADQLAGGVAVAPVVDWRLYDSAYTERYLGQPDENPDGYTQSSPLSWLDGLKGRLCLIHGMADDNVLFLHSAKLIAALQQRDVDFQLMTYPNGKHGLNNAPGQRLHVHRLISRFFCREIAGRTID